MTYEDYQRHVDEFLSEMREVTESKNTDYSAGTGDAMHDYKAAAEECDVTPIKAWLVLLMKHVRAVQRYARDGRVTSEPIRGRMIDIANYAMLGSALVEDLRRGGRDDEDAGDRGAGESSDLEADRMAGGDPPDSILGTDEEVGGVP